MNARKEPLRDDWKVEAEDDLESLQKTDPALAQPRWSKTPCWCRRIS